MADLKLRQAIAHEAARLMYDRVESEYYTAKWKAARRLSRGRCKPEDLPSNAEIRQLIQTFAHLHEGDRRTDNLKAMRFAALRMMRELRLFRPRLIGSVLTGHVRSGSDIDIHVFSDSTDAVVQIIESLDLRYEIERKTVRKDFEAREYTHIHVTDRYEFELTVYAADLSRHVFRSSITGGPIERASIGELEKFLTTEYPEVDLETLETTCHGAQDPFPIFRLLLLPLEGVKQSAEYHPEGNALYHSLQVFEQAREAQPYDSEFLLAALLHDVGKGIEPRNHVEAALRSLSSHVTERTAYLIRHHMDAHEYRDGTLPERQRLKLQRSEDFDDLLLLAECDRAGRQPGAVVCSIDEALDYIRCLERDNEG
ncbi:MAG: HD domain-containing protein [Gemmataceae bacterium]|nr:HD domain-containing protein [Gemmataceae bacterium]